MNATWTLNLFPAHWRARYEPTFRQALTARPASIADSTNLMLGAGMVHLRPGDREHLPASRPTPPSAPPRSRQTAWMSGLWGHFILFLVVNMAQIGINLLTTPDTIWFPYVLAGSGIALAIHTALTWPGPRGLWGVPLVTGVTSVALVVINITNGGTAWSVWPVWALISAMAVFTLYARGNITSLGAHVLALALVGVEIVAAAVVADASNFWQSVAFAMSYATITVIVHAWFRLRHASLLQAHTLLFVLTNALLALDARIGDESNWWFVIPLAAWSVLLAAHALIAHRLARTPEGEWERSMIASLTGPTEHGTRARAFGLKTHLVVFGVGVSMLALVNLLTLDAGWWLIWPLSSWLVVLAAHIGMLAIARYPNLGIWLFGGGMAAIWIVVLDLATAGGPWWFWPVGAWAVLTPVIASLNINLLGLISTHDDEHDAHNALS